MADNLLSEVDAELRAERMQQLWLQYRFKLFLLVAAIILATAGNVVWKNYQVKRGGELLSQFHAAQGLYDAGKLTEAAAGYEAIATDASGETRTLAQVWQARALAAANKKPEAVAVLKTASAGKANLWSDLACLRLASIEMEAAKDCLADTKDSPLAQQRREWQAASLWATGDKAKAIALLEQLQTSPDTSELTRATTGQWLATMRAEGTPVTEGVK